MNTTKLEDTIGFCEDCGCMLYSFMIPAHVLGPADLRSLEIVSERHEKECAWVERATSALSGAKQPATCRTLQNQISCLTV